MPAFADSYQNVWRGECIFLMNLVLVLHAPIAAAAAKTMSLSESKGLDFHDRAFIDTLIICTLTGLTILVTGGLGGDLRWVP